MGGRVLDYEGRSIFYDGIAVGEERGKERGRREATLETARRLRKMGMSDSDIQVATNISISDLAIL